MKLTKHTDFALRVMMYLAIRPKALHTIPEISEKFHVSKNHLMKVVNNLVNHGYLESVRGRSGGLRLAKAPSKIRIGKVVKEMETSMELVECGDCPLAPCCKLKDALADATQTFIKTLNKFTLADISSNERQLLRLVG